MSGTGKIIFQERSNASFDSIVLHDYVNLILTQDCTNNVTVEAGEKIIDGIHTYVENNTLYISNRNICNWTRDYGKPINVHVGVRKLCKIEYESSGNVSSTNTISSDNLKIDVLDGCGTIKININTINGVFVERMGTVDFILEGRAIFNDIYSAGYGPFHCENLHSDYSYVTSLGSNDCYIRAWRGIDVRISSIGNIYYTGNPETIQQCITGPGKLIPF